MPSIDIQVLEDGFTPGEKAEIIHRVTDAFGSVSGDTIKNGTTVRIHEIKSGAWGWGGQVLTTADGRAMRSSG